MESSHPPDADRPFVSVVVPTCNRREALTACLEALARQTYADYEVVVVDDCSTDGTDALLADFGSRHLSLQIRVLRNEVHAGANPSRNRGVRAAQGELVAFLDSDCTAAPGWLAHLVRAFDDPNVAAVSGLVIDTSPRNLFELTVKGTHRLHRSGDAHRLVAGNLCVRRELLVRYGLDEDRAAPVRDSVGRPDVSVSGRGDEEGLFLILRAAGYRQLVVPEAAVTHDHRTNARSFVRQAFRSGRSAARLVYKFRLPPRLDLAPFLLAYLTLPLMFVHPSLVWVTVLFGACAILAITYNDLARKGKTPLETLISFPLLLVYYHIRLAGYLTETLRLYCTRHTLERTDLTAVPRATPS